MKKVLSLVLALLMVLALAACSAPAANDGGESQAPAASDGGDAAEPSAEGEAIEISVRGLPKGAKVEIELVAYKG